MPGVTIVLIAAILLLGAGFMILPVLGYWGIPAILLGGVLGLAYLRSARQGGDPSVGAIKSGRRDEPTGVPRKSASGSAQTANERVGQE